MADMAGRPHKLPGWLGEAVRFAVVGGSAAGVDYGVLWIGMALGLSPQLARVPAVAVAMCFTWWFNRKLTFKTERAPSWREFGHYVSVAMAGILLNLSIYWIALWAGAPVWLAFVLGTGITAVFSFLRYKVILGHG